MMNESGETVCGKTLSVHVLAAHGVLLVGLFAAIVMASVHVNMRPHMPTLNRDPHEIRPLYDDPLVVSDHQLAMVLGKATPSFTSLPPKVNFIDHALRMWSHRAEFSTDAIDGSQMLAMLLDQAAFHRMWGDATPLLQASPEGISVRTQEGNTSVSHVDHLLGTLAECGVPLTYPVRLANGSGHVGDLLLHALRTFRLDQREYEWTALAAAFYAADGQSWVTCEGQQISFDTLASRLMRQPQPEGVCYGNHRIYTLVMLLRIDSLLEDQARTGLLTDGVRREIVSYLTDMTRRLHASQNTAGYWDGDWAQGSGDVPDPGTDEQSRRILATGHALEWWAMAPLELQPPRETVIRAAQWLVRSIEAMESRQIERNFTFLTHAARALALWRGRFPCDCINEM